MKRTARGLVGNIVLTGILVFVGLGSLRFLGSWGNQMHPVDGWAALLVVVAALAAGGLRWWPLISFALCAATIAVYLVVGYPYGPILLSLVLATYTLARWVRLRVAVIAAVIALPLLLVHAFTEPAGLNGFWGLLPGMAWIVVPFTVGLTRRVVVDNAARQRAETERRALDDERVRLASEVHDIVGHGLAAIQMQADVALHVRERNPEQVEIALEAISRASADALAELRATLAAIAPEGAGQQSRDSHAPTPGLARVEDLCARMRESGIRIDLAILGAVRPVDTAVDVAAYRVVQESLTNVAKHATERRARVEVRYESHAVRVEVVNPAASAAPVREGFGITGMRRRVDDVGGEITVAGTGREFRVTATFPG